MRGIRFFIPKKYDKYLWRIFELLDCMEYTWYISQDEVFFYDETESKVSNDFFESRSLHSENFIKKIAECNYLIYLVNIQAYPVGALKDNILTYDDFIRSNCEMVLLCVDSKYVDLYSKNDEFTSKVFEMCIQNRFKKVEYITDENDERTRLSL